MVQWSFLKIDLTKHLFVFFMYYSYTEDTIAAVATPPGHGGIAIIRVSGKSALSSVSKLARKDLHLQDSHTVKLVDLYSEENTLLDKALILVMRGPKSFTGEETVEIHCHGGYLIARSILHSLFKGDVRPAQPGEFSFRAFMNGKIDLVQAEAISDLIFAKNEEALCVAEDHLAGALSSRVRDFQRRATDVAAFFEASVDFPEDDLEELIPQNIFDDLQMLLSEIESLGASFERGKIIHEGVTLCIVGSPNVGKSSLMNRLLGKDRAIVSEIPGTTRDIVEAEMMLHGLHVHLIDTAGIRETDGVIEKEGIARSRQAFSRADIILCVADSSRSADDAMLSPLFEVPSEKAVVVWNKIDIFPAAIEKTILGAPHVGVSALTGEGVEKLLAVLKEKIFGKESHRRQETLITNLRHQEALRKAKNCLQSVIDGYRQKISPEFLALEMKGVLLHLGSIIGTDVTEDVLSAIFSKFCIGK